MPIVIPFVLFGIAFLYASVGHGGASGYLAVWSLTAPASMATSALWLNVLVAGTAWWMFAHAGHWSWRMTWPWVAGSVPAAVVGGWMTVPVETYRWLLAATLAAAAARLAWTAPRVVETVRPAPPLAVALPIGAGVGLLSGIVGIGGGILLTPLLLLRRWATPQQAAGTSACFIVANSVAGLGGRAVSGQWMMQGMWPAVIAAFLGGFLGARWGARDGRGPVLRRLLAVVLVIAACHLVIRRGS